jgi:hypothetical protein
MPGGQAIVYRPPACGKVGSPGAVLQPLNTLGEGIIPGLDELVGGRRGWPRGERHRRDGSHQRPTLHPRKRALVWPQGHGALHGYKITSTAEDDTLATRLALCDFRAAKIGTGIGTGR